MAFQQQRPQAPRPLSFTKQPVDNQQVPVSPTTHRRTLEDSQEWILFSPRSDGHSRSCTSQTPRTATHLSDYGSLQTHTRSQPVNDDSHDAGEATCLGTEIDDDEEDDNAELDSLDDGLHAFHHHPFSSSSHQLDQSGGAVLPTHDGLGMFPSSAGLQEQLWQFERHNPHRKRHVRRRSSVQKKLDKMEEEEDVDETDERTARIERWRLEQSRAVLEEIERETRRRRRRMSRMSGISNGSDMQIDPPESVAAATLGKQKQRMDSVITREEQQPEITINKSEEEASSSEQVVSETWWQRLTRRVIQDLIGLDETTLSVIFGEQLPDDEPTPTPSSPIAVRASQESRVTFHDRGYSWETKLLERIAKELGILVHQLSEHEGGAFSTYMRTREEPEYAGLPPLLQTQTSLQPTTQQQRQRKRSSERVETADASETLFVPTLPPAEANDTSLWGIEEEEPSRLTTTTTTSQSEAATRHQQQQQQQQAEREYWERDVDVKMIFHYLKRRLSQHPPPSSPPTPAAPLGPLPASWNTDSQPTVITTFGTSPESLRRAEVIRRQHPLVSRAAERAAAAAQKNRLRRDAASSSSILLMRRTQKRAGESSSCASQSTKRSRQTRSASSRHYWDLGGSVGSAGSAGGGGGGGSAANGGGLGAWGEV